MKERAALAAKRREAVAVKNAKKELHSKIQFFKDSIKAELGRKSGDELRKYYCYAKKSEPSATAHQGDPCEECRELDLRAVAVRNICVYCCQEDSRSGKTVERCTFEVFVGTSDEYGEDVVKMSAWATSKLEPTCAAALMCATFNTEPAFLLAARCEHWVTTFTRTVKRVYGEYAVDTMQKSISPK